MAVDGVRELVEEVRRSGATLCLDNDTLKVSSSESVPEELLARLRERMEDIAAYLGAVEFVPSEQMTQGEQLSRNLSRAMEFHAAVLAKPPAWGNPQILHIQSRSADTTLNAASRLQAANLAAKQDLNRVPSQRLLEAVERVDRELRGEREAAERRPV